MEFTFDQLPQAVNRLFEKLDSIEKLLNEKGGSIAVEPERLLTLNQAADFLSLKPPTLYGLVHNQRIPVCKQGKRLYFSQKELIDWIKAGRKKTTAQISLEAEAYLKTKRRGGR